MILRIQKIVHRKENDLHDFKCILFSMFFFLFSIYLNAQDSIPEAKDFTEEKELKFQQFFFKALSQKSIGNHQKAIENLENCNQVLPNDLTVFFEFSKNYLELNNTFLAKEYISRAIEKSPKNIWMQKHLVKILVKDKNFSEAIKVQQTVVDLNSKGRDYLARLYLQNRDYKNVLRIMKDLEGDNSLSLSLKRIKQSLENLVKPEVKEEIVSVDLIKKFKTDKSYVVLKQILVNSIDNPIQLLKYSKEGVMLFPAQPFVYLMNGKALNAKNEYKKALEILNSGIDFVIEDAMEADFYNEIAISYKGLGNNAAEKKYKEKSEKLKK